MISISSIAYIFKTWCIGKWKDDTRKVHIKIWKHILICFLIYNDRCTFSWPKINSCLSLHYVLQMGKHLLLLSTKSEKFIGTSLVKIFILCNMEWQMVSFQIQASDWVPKMLCRMENALLIKSLLMAGRTNKHVENYKWLPPWFLKNGGTFLLCISYHNFFIYFGHMSTCLSEIFI